MLIDWITARLSFDFFSVDEIQALRLHTDRILRFNPKTGETVWETSAWDSIRSDSHQLAFKIGSDALWVQGSPARIIGDGDNVFSSGCAAALDLVACVDRMANFAFDYFNLTPRANPQNWTVSRVDVTGNLYLDSYESVLQALSLLKNIEGGRYRVSAQSGNTVYLGGRSRLKRAKIYSKGGHLQYINSKRNYDGRIYTDQEVQLANHLLRLELTLGAQFFRERRYNDMHWFEFQPGDLAEIWNDYFEKMIGDSTVMNEETLHKKVLAVAPTPGQAKAAIVMWLLIEKQGLQATKDLYSKPTYYRNLKVLRNAGLGDLDFSHGNIVQLRKKVLECEIVESWNELLTKAA